jgi:putative transposase
MAHCTSLAHCEPAYKKRAGSIPSFNSKLRDECLNEHVFLSLAEARQTIEAWRYDYDHLRPHGSLGALTPNEFATLKGQQTKPPQEGEINHGLYL